MAVQETRQKSFFSSRKFGLYQHALTALEHASILSPSIRSPHGSANGYASMKTYLLFALYLLLGIGSFPFLYLLLSMKSLEPFGTPIALELRASFFAPREASTPVYFSFFFSSFSSCLCTKLKYYGTAFTTNHKKQYHCSHPSRVKSLQYIRRPPSYKPHQLLSSFSACPGKRSFPFPFSLFASDPHFTPGSK